MPHLSHECTATPLKNITRKGTLRPKRCHMPAFINRSSWQLPARTSIRIQTRIKPNSQQANRRPEDLAVWTIEKSRQFLKGKKQFVETVQDSPRRTQRKKHLMSTPPQIKQDDFSQCLQIDLRKGSRLDSWDSESLTASALWKEISFGDWMWIVLTLIYCW